MNLICTHMYTHLFADFSHSEFPGLLAIPGCQLVYQLSRHSSLGNALHLFPENVLIGGDDIVPGIREGPPDGT